MPTVFISHSCKDKEKQPPAGLSKAQVAVRKARLDFARKLRDALRDTLTKQKKKGFKVFVDVRDLKGGDIWQDSLHSELRTCDVGIVLLTPESLDSGWVLKEATILSWRVFQREPILLVPVILGVTQEELASRGFGALGLPQIQWVTVDGTDPKALKKAVTDVVAALQHIQPGLGAARTLKPIDLWIEEFAQHLEAATATTSATLTTHYLVKMCEALQIHPQQRARLGKKPFGSLAAQALLANADQIVDLLNDAGKPDRDLRAFMQEAVAPLWIDPVPASRLAHGGQVIAINAVESRSVREYIDRAFCNKIDNHRVIEPSDVTNGSDTDVLAEVERSLGKFYNLGDPTAIKRVVDRRGPVFVILGPGSVRESVLDTLTGRYPDVTFVTTAGLAPDKCLGQWWTKAQVLHPMLGQNREAEALLFRNQLASYVNKGQRPSA